ncbi:Membrane protein UL56 [Caenorhabditis elegans]|uniref:Membrane protein UL56 n=1 Tax=Caenorhabditis elegans TaxID=6239 RepID=Q21328_CAEEL|nr:Membrane protein UL56 [Caenorhabditis elegans]CAA97433.2 Membrane protein UL56 [Caenorhabditis elegans]|eukprot:NP_502459.2 Uncharacterized protein CELE_K08D8.2 [Caenorhabditis elegans]
MTSQLPKNIYMEAPISSAPPAYTEVALPAYTVASGTAAGSQMAPSRVHVTERIIYTDFSNQRIPRKNQQVPRSQRNSNCWCIACICILIIFLFIISIVFATQG